MSERRESPRWLTFRTGRIQSIATPSEIVCAILDISETGACILIPVGAQVHEVFDLAMDPEGASVPCRVAWRSGNRIGVSFRAPFA
jgi:hypothetical protein